MAEELIITCTRFFVTNGIPKIEEFRALPFVSVRCLSDTLSRTINRVHYNRSISELFCHCQVRCRGGYD
jgi:phosphoribosylpyrophosphate synthetase